MFKHIKLFGINFTRKECFSINKLISLKFQHITPISILNTKRLQFHNIPTLFTPTSSLQVLDL